ncbi:hypothetical protein TNIN_140931 [Trichonephila inaurata madagascariensis]|uniref:Uncharacterized protein n=1 Tax=Trichonephila inaurata madagascariensis TaxID=2747483 RepID=A0A8X7CJJ4_9ARAC|nr:hypothetical protein TNIN_140931 [Trichonephila inaurata madagascariensis]
MKGGGLSNTQKECARGLSETGARDSRPSEFVCCFSSIVAPDFTVTSLPLSSLSLNFYLALKTRDSAKWYRSGQNCKQCEKGFSQGKGETLDKPLQIFMFRMSHLLREEGSQLDVTDGLGESIPDET